VAGAPPGSFKVRGGGLDTAGVLFAGIATDRLPVMVSYRRKENKLCLEKNSSLDSTVVR
jgi:hypothetical protein